MMRIMTRIVPASVLGGLFLLAAGCGEKTTATPSGLKYADKVIGKGPEVKSGDFVEVQFIGWLQADDTQFGSSREEKGPFRFRLGKGEVIKGWDEGIAGMKVGGKRKLYIPAALGFGDKSQGLLLPPNSDLLYEIELVRILDEFKTEDLKLGTGPEVKYGDVVEVQFVGRLQANDTHAGSSREEKGPVLLRLGIGEVIKGWDAGIAGMKVGGKRKLYIPAVLGFGDKSQGPLLPPNSDLLYEIELVRILDGFKMEDLKEGTGPIVKWTDTVEALYTGWLKDGGTKFDSNVESGIPLPFQIGGQNPQMKVIHGWESGVCGMKVGGKRKLTIPAELAYGKAGSPPKIPADADLVFEVEIVNIMVVRWLHG